MYNLLHVRRMAPRRRLSASASAGPGRAAGAAPGATAFGTGHRAAPHGRNRSRALGRNRRGAAGGLGWDLGDGAGVEAALAACQAGHARQLGERAETASGRRARPSRRSPPWLAAGSVFEFHGAAQSRAGGAATTLTL